MVESLDIKSNSLATDNNKSIENIDYLQCTFMEAETGEPVKFDDVADDDLLDTEKQYEETNNIFLKENNLNHDNNVVNEENKKQEDRVIINLINPPNGYREFSIAFNRMNINKLLRGKIALDDLMSKLRYRGKHKPCIIDKEVARIVNSYIQVAKNLKERPFSYYDEDVVTSFIKFYKSGEINNILSFYVKKLQAKNKRVSDNSSSENIMFQFNTDVFRELHFEITPNNMSFNPHEDREMFILDYVRMYWELYMLLVFMDICKIAQEDEASYFEQFYKYISLAVFTGMKIFLQLDLGRSYGELYEELKGFKPINGKYLSVQGVKEKQQLNFRILNSDFLTEAYRNEYQGAIHIDKSIGDIKKDKHIDIELAIMKGDNNNSVLIEITISGQNTLGRIYSADTKPDVNINMNNMYFYELSVIQPSIYLFRTCLNYSKDLKVTSYYTELQEYLAQYKGVSTHGLVTKLIAIILLAIYKRPNDKELTSILDKHFKPTDKEQKAEVRRIYKELRELLPIKQDRLVDKLRKELWKVVW